MKDLRAAVPPTPERFLSKMDQTLKEVQDMQHIKSHRHKYGALAIALIGALLLATLAYAAANPQGILSRLFPNATPSPEALSAITHPGAKDAKDGLTLSVDEYLFDGSTLNFDWTVSSERADPVYYLTSWTIDAEQAVGSSRSMESSDGGDPTRGWFTVLDGKNSKPGVGRARSDYFKCTDWEAVPQKPFDVSITVYAFESPLKPVLLNHHDSLSVPLNRNDPLLSKWDAAGQIGVSMYNEASIHGYKREQEVAERLHPGDPERRLAVEDYQQTGLMDPIATLSVRVNIDPADAKRFWHTEPIERALRYSGGRIELETLDMSATSSRMAYHIYPDAPIPEDDIGALHGLLLDASGKPLWMSGSAEHSTDEGSDGWVYYTAEGNPLPAPPETVLLMPCLTSEQAGDALISGVAPEGERIPIPLKTIQ